jgi:transposase
MTKVEQFHGMSLEDIKKQVRKCKDTRKYERWLCISHSIKGYSVSEIADLLFRNEQTIREWIEAFNREGAKGLERISPSGIEKKNN